MSYSKYQYVVTVAEMQSISKAAKELYMSQPALTKYINKLEEEIGVKLFNRNVIPISLTYAGERFVEEAKKILSISNRLDKELEDISEMKKGRLTVGASISRGGYWLPNVFPVYQKRYPGIELKMVEGSYSYLEDKLEKGIIDVILTALPFFSEQIDFEVLTEERIILVMPTSHPLLEGVDLSQNSLDNLIQLDPHQLNGENFISLASGSGIGRMVAKLFELHNIKPKNFIETQDIDTAYSLATRGMGFTFVSDVCIEGFFPDYLPALCTVGNQPLNRNSIAAYKKGDYLPYAVRKFIETTREVVQTCPDYRKISHDEFVQARCAAKENDPYQRWFDSM